MELSTINLTQQLIEAVIKNDLKQVGSCIEQGVDPNSYEDYAKIRPLHFAVIYQAFECVKILIIGGADPFLKNKDGESPVDLACELNHRDVLNLFRWHTLH